MGNDRELLELAAKAVGIEVTPNMNGWEEKYPLGWNPLTDDGDALRLAVKLRMMVDCVCGADVIEIFVNGKIRHIDIDITDPDPYAATRRAIVRAAAHIGESMV